MAATSRPRAAAESPGAAASNAERLERFHQEIKNCMRCPLGATRTRFVFGSGNPDAEILLIGEAPGFHEDQKGVPFVGAAGNLLNKVLAQVGLVREDIYICNVLKCRPPNNRTPLRAEIESCQPYLREQIDIIRPRVIGTMGNPATQIFLPDFRGITKSRGKVHTWNGYTVLPIYHPAAALYRNALVESLVDDFRQLRGIAGAPPPSAEPRFRQPTLF